MADEQRPEEVQRCTAKRRAASVLSPLKGETRQPKRCVATGLKFAEVEELREIAFCELQRMACAHGLKKTRR